MREKMAKSSETKPKNTEMSSGIEDAVYQELMEMKILTLPTFLADRQLDGKNYSTWAMMMEVVLQTYDLSVMVLQNVEHPTASNVEEDIDYTKQAY